MSEESYREELTSSLHIGPDGKICSIDVETEQKPQKYIKTTPEEEAMLNKRDNEIIIEFLFEQACSYCRFYNGIYNPDGFCNAPTPCLSEEAIEILKERNIECISTEE